MGGAETLVGSSLVLCGVSGDLEGYDAFGHDPSPVGREVPHLKI